MMLFIRHGDRADEGSDEEKKEIEKSYDPHLTQLGCWQSKQTGEHLNKILSEYASKHQLDLKDVEPIIVSSPYLRCLMSTVHIVKQLPRILENAIFVQDEFGEVMYSHYFTFFALPEIHLKASDWGKLESKYLGLGEIKVKGAYFKDERLVLPKYPESSEEVWKRVSTNLQVVMENYVKAPNSLRNPVIVVTHQGVMEVGGEL